MSSFSFPPARPRSQVTNRPQPQRVNSNNNRTTPYQRPGNFTSTASTTPSSTGSSGKWQHDLFGESSDLYKPSINVQHLSRIIPGAQPIPQHQSASLRPFGDATPAPQRLISTASNPLPPPTPQTVQQQQNPDLFTRLGIKGSSSQAQLQQQERERLRLEKSERVRLERERREALRLRKEQEKDYQERLAIAEQEETGFVVQVEGLVFGTSGEDVQTAFASYGEIKHCFIVDEKTAKEGDQLIARITFSKHAEATTACHKLDGAIADGRPLRVQNVPRSPFPKALPPFEHSSAPASPASSSSTLPTGPRGGGGARGATKMGPSRTANATPPQIQASVPTPIPSKMYADTVESYSNPPSSLPAPSNDSMDLDPSPSYPPSVPQVAPIGPRRGGGHAARGGMGRGGMRPGPPAGLSARVQPTPQAQVQQPQGGSLLDRMNGGGQGKKVGNVQPVQANSNGGAKSLSLAERMGQAQGQTQGRKGAAKGGAVNGKAVGGGGSLLDRLK